MNVLILLEIRALQHHVWSEWLPVFSVWLQACDEVTRPRFHGDSLVVYRDDIGGDLRTVAAWLFPLQEEASRRGVTRLGGRREVQESEGRDLVRMCRRCLETCPLTVWTSASLVHRLSKTQRSTGR